MTTNRMAGRVPARKLAPWRWVMMAAAAMLLLSGAGWLQPTAVSAGQAATVVTDGAPLFANHDNLTVIEWMENGTRVDVFWGPHNWLYEVRYYGTVGWTWGENLALDGAGSAASASKASSAASSSGERWIDVNRSTGAVTLYEGNTVLSVSWGSLSRSQGEGYYATASGTYYIYAKNRSLTYTPFADNYISHWVGFDSERRNGFHSYTKNASGSIIPGGGGYTAGCVALPPGDIDVLYDFAQIGMRVEVHW